MDGWVGDQTGPSNLLIFKYVNKQYVLITNMVSKFVYGSLIKSSDHFSSFFLIGKKYSVSFIFLVIPLNRKRKLTMMSTKTRESRAIEILHN